MSAARGAPGAGWWAPAAIVALLAAVCGVALVVELYESLAESQRLRELDEPSTAQASAIAIRLLPWKADAHRLLALSLAVTDHGDDAREQARQALRWAPGEAEMWRVLARTLAFGGHYGPALTDAVTQAQALAPQAADLHFSLALDALYAWPYADPETHALWLRSLRFSLRRDNARFLRRVAVLRRENAFCYYAGATLRRQRWCAEIGPMRAACGKSELAPGRRAFCDRVGLRRPNAP